ncbi:MAG: CNNM domain-containing protein, partial [Phycisphaeraceae bacterium]|nr:CNNM domain-containing protein [Phycisphaeraceae bacterium]
MPDPALWIALTAAVLSCYFAACTMSLRTFSKARMAELLAGRNLENRLDQFIDRAPKLQLICSTLRTLMNLALFVAVLIWFEELRDASVLWYYAASLGLALLLTIVFSVAIASSIARHRPERLLARSIVLLNALHLLLWPIARLLLLLELFVRRLLGAGEDEESDSPLADEILAVVDEH